MPPVQRDLIVHHSGQTSVVVSGDAFNQSSGLLVVVPVRASYDPARVDQVPLGNGRLASPACTLTIKASSVMNIVGQITERERSLIFAAFDVITDRA